MRKAKHLTGWFVLNDARFGLRIKDLDPYEQGEAICERYGFNFTEIRGVYTAQGQEAGDAYLLDKLNFRTTNG